MTLAIIAAGEGSRLHSEGIDTPKPLIKINGTPMIDRIIRIAVNNNFDKVFCIVNEYSDSLKEHLLSTDYKIPVRVFTKTTLSSLHSLYEMRLHLLENFVLTTADTIFSEKEFRNFIDYTGNNIDFDVLLSVTSDFDDDKPLCVEINEADKIISFHNERDHHRYATAGIYYFRMNPVSDLEHAVNSGVHRLRNFFSMLLSRGAVLEAYRFGRVIDVDHVQDILQAEQFLNSLHEQE